MAVEGEILEVLRGKSGRLFLSAAPFFNAAGLLSGTSPFLNAWKYRIETIANGLARRGQPLFLFIAPEAHSVYTDELPDDVAPIERTLGQRLVDSVRDMPNVHPVYPLQALREAKGDMDVYLRNDTHWSSYGAYIAYRQLCEALSSSKAVETIPADDIRYELKLRFGNLGSAVEPELRVDTPFAVLPQPGDHVKSERSYARNYYRRADCPAKSGRLLTAHDSFMTELGVFASGTFAEMHSYGIDANIYFDLVDRLKPDWIVLERAESGLLLPPPVAKPDGFSEIYQTDWSSAVGKIATDVAIALDWGGRVDGLDDFAYRDLEPGHLFVRAKAALSVHSLDRALADMTALVQMEPHHAPYRILLARIQSVAWNFEEAVRHAEIAYELAPESAFNAQTLVHSHLHLPDAPTAVARFDDLSTMIKDDTCLYHWGSVARYRNGDAPGAMEALEHALEIEPGHPGLLEWSGQLRMLANVA